MILELSQYKRSNSRTKYVWKMKTEIYEKIKEVAAENKAYPSVVMRYIIDWACDKMNDDEKFRDYILENSLKKGYIEGNKTYTYTLSKELNDKLVETNRKYRMLNINFFVVESVKIFFEKNEK